MPKLLIALLLVALPAAAQDIPACNQDRVGAVACMAGKMCACSYHRGGSVSGRPEGYNWDCGILRPACVEALAPPGGGAAPLLPLPGRYVQLPPPRSPWSR